MRAVNYVLYRYEVTDEDDNVVGGRAHHAMLEDSRGKPTSYRAEDTSTTRKNTLMRLRPEHIHEEFVLTFDVGYSITERLERRWDTEADEYNRVSVSADDLIFTSFVLIPRLSVVAVRDGHTDQLSASAGMGRLRSIIENHSDYWFRYSKSANPDDVDHAMRTFRLTEFSFDVRPFNPHPAAPGERLHELMIEAGVGRFRGKAEPSSTKPMSAEEEGLVAEAVGLSRKGYGQFSLKAETESGAKLTFGKPPFQQDRERSAAAAERPRMLKVAVPYDDPDMTEQEHVVSVMLELFGAVERTA